MPIITNEENASWTPEQLDKAKQARDSRVARLRRALSLSQRAFAKRYAIPLGTVRDWEQGRREPDAAAEALLRVIEQHPNITANVLAAE